ncbi:hypothetical protein FQA39_LY10932 [Lamprigera yunnana]|nr:hypothetical protein FQA39_LY10932 [Lamprigera yunnana]
MVTVHDFKKLVLFILNFPDVEYLLCHITDDIAADSEVEGDEDAEDDLIINNTLRTSTKSSGLGIGNNSNKDDIEIDETEEVPSYCPKGKYSISSDSGSDTSNDQEDNDSSDDSYNWNKVGRTPEAFSKAEFAMPFGITPVRASTTLNKTEASA